MANKPWSVWAADSLMKRREMLNDKWQYDYGVAFKGLEEVYDATGGKQYFNYIEKTMDWFVREDGTVQLYRQAENNIDHINNGKALLFMYNNTAGDVKERYKKAAGHLRDQLSVHPRTSEGAFWHKQIYPYQIWLDGIYMGSPFYAQYIRDIEKGDDYSDVTKQFLISFKYLYDPVTQLMHHAWDETKNSFWCDKKTGLSENFWSRSIGWYAMACADVLDYLPANDPDRAKIIEIYEKVVDGMLRWKDPATNVWYQVTNMADRKGNYLEASASCMMVHAMAKGIVRGYLSADKYSDTVKQVYKGVLDEFVTVTSQNLVNLNKVVQVSGLGPEDRTERDGSFAYYISEPIVSNDLKGYGVFISASAYMEQL